MRRCSNGVRWLAVVAVFVINGYSDACEPPLAPIESRADEPAITTGGLPLLAVPAATGAKTNAPDRKSPTVTEPVDVSVPAVIERLQQLPPEVPWDALPASYQRILKELMLPAATQRKRRLGDRSRDEIWDLSLAETIHLALNNNKMLRVRWGFRTAEYQVLAAGDTPPTVFDPIFHDFGELLRQRGLAAALSAFDSQKLFPTTNSVPLQYPHSLEEWSWIEFTRIAGRINGRLGDVSGCRGVVISRNTTDVSVTDFERNVQNTLRNVEDTYWDLYLAYRTYDIHVEARNSFLRTWRFAQANQQAARFTDLDELQARQAYFQGKADCQGALQNLYNLETKLRRLCALPGTDGRIIRTRDDPSTGEYIPDWNQCLAEAWTRREEVRRNIWNVKSLETQLWAAKAALPQPRSDETQLSQAREELANKARQVCDELTTTFQNLASRFQATQLNYNRWQTAAAQIAGSEDRYRNGPPGVDTSVLLQQCVTTRSDAATAEVGFYSSLVEYQKSLTDLHFRKGTLLELNDVHLAESSWTLDACNDALRRALARSYESDFSIDVRAQRKPDATDFSESP